MSNEVPTPKPAATVILLRDSPGGLEVLMVDRHRHMAGFAGARVFPGGRVDDTDLALATQLPDLGLPPESVPFRIAAVRETFEEAGLLLARPEGSQALVSGDRVTGFAEARTALQSNAAEFGALLKRERLTPAIDLLVPYAHWVTPAVITKRYDTHFFIVAAPVDHIADHDTGELANLLWISPKQCISDGAAKTCKLEVVTRLNLSLLLPANTVAEALAIGKARRIMTVLPDANIETRTTRIPLEAGYGGEVFSLD